MSFSWNFCDNNSTEAIVCKSMTRFVCLRNEWGTESNNGQNHWATAYCVSSAFSVIFIYFQPTIRNLVTDIYVYLIYTCSVICTQLCWRLIAKDSFQENMMNRGKFWGLVTCMLCYTFPVERKECFKRNNESHSWHSRLMANSWLVFNLQDSLESCFSASIRGIRLVTNTVTCISESQN